MVVTPPPAVASMFACIVLTCICCGSELKEGCMDGSRWSIWKFGTSKCGDGNAKWTLVVTVHTYKWPLHALWCWQRLSIDVKHSMRLQFDAVLGSSQWTGWTCYQLPVFQDLKVFFFQYYYVGTIVPQPHCNTVVVAQCNTVVLQRLQRPQMWANCK